VRALVLQLMPTHPLRGVQKISDAVFTEKIPMGNSL
jgi:hypothetical protein